MGVHIETSYSVRCDYCHRPIGGNHLTVNAAIDNAGRLGEQVYDPRWFGRPMVWRCMECRASRANHATDRTKGVANV